MTEQAKVMKKVRINEHNTSRRRSTDLVSMGIFVNGLSGKIL